MSNIIEKFSEIILERCKTVKTDISIFQHLFENPEIHWLNNDIRIALFTDLNLNSEVKGDGYSSGGKSLKNKKVIKDSKENTLSLCAENISWEDSSIKARYGILYDKDKDISLCLIDFGKTEETVEGSFNI